MEKLIITVATTGAGTTLSKNPYLAITPKHISEEVYECYKAGASVAHIHVREDDGGRSMNFDKFKETVERIRDKCDILINLTTSGAEFSEDIRLKPLLLKPDLASFNAGSTNFGAMVFANSLGFMETLAKTMNENNVKPEIEIYCASMIENSQRLFKRGFFKGPLHYQFVLGIDGGMSATPKNLLFLKETIPDDATWGVLSTGKSSTAMSSMSMHMGGHVRVGMEDNIYIKKGILAKHNVEFLDKIKRMADEFERPIANVAEARKILNL